MKLDMLILIAGRGLQALLTVALFRVITHFLAPAQIGGVYLMFSVSYLFTSFLINPVSAYIGRKLFAWHDQKNIFEHLSGYNYYVALVSVMAFPLVWLLWRFLGVGAGLSGTVFAAEVCCYIYMLTWNVTLIPILNSLGHRIAFVLLTVTAAALGLVFSPLFAYFGAASAEYWMAGQIVALGLVNAAGVRTFRKVVPEPQSAPPIRRYAGKPTLSGVGAFAVPIAVSAFFMWAQGQSYRLIVERMSGAEFLGYLAVGFSIATSVAGILESLVQQIYLPEFYRRVTDGNKTARAAALSDLAAQAIPVYIIYLFFLIGLSEFLLHLLVAEKYRTVFVFARYGALVEFCRMVTNVFGVGTYSEMDTKALIKPYFWGGLAAVAGVYFASLSPAHGILVPAALAGSGLITAIAMASAVKAMNPYRLEYSAAFKTAAASILFLPFAFFSPRGFWQAAAALAVAGAYFIFLQYRAGRRWLGKTGRQQEFLPQPAENTSIAEQ